MLGHPVKVNVRRDKKCKIAVNLSIFLDSTLYMVSMDLPINSKALKNTKSVIRYICLT